MNIKEQINWYINSQCDLKHSDMQALLKVLPKCNLWFLDVKDGKGEIVSNYNIGLWSYIIKYADGTRVD